MTYDLRNYYGIVTGTSRQNREICICRTKTWKFSSGTQSFRAKLSRREWRRNCKRVYLTLCTCVCVRMGICTAERTCSRICVGCIRVRTYASVYKCESTRTNNISGGGVLSESFKGNGVRTGGQRSHAGHRCMRTSG